MSMTRSSAHQMSSILLLLLVMGAQTSCESKPREVYEIPSGYRGWVEVRAKRSECPPLRSAGNATIFVVPATGIACTSSPIAFGFGREEYYYVGAGERLSLRHSPVDPQSMIWQKEYYGSAGTGPALEQQRDRIRFFVGTRSEYEKESSREQ